MALDLATRSGFCVGPYGKNSKPVFGHHDLPSKSKNLAGFLSRHEVWLSGMIERHGVGIVVFESPLLVARGKSTSETIAKLRGLAMQTEHVCRVKRLDCYETNNSTIKKFFAGSGRAKKPQMIEAANERGFLTNEDNEADACAIWLHAIATLDMKHHTTYAGRFERGLFAS